MQLPFKYTPPGGGGGGGSIPTITVNTTINVPTDQPTLAAALAWVRARVVLNGVTVTINVESALIPTINEQLIVQYEDMPYLQFTNDGPVNVDTTGFALTPLGIRAFIYVFSGHIGPLGGTWTQTAGPAAIGLVNIAAHTSSLAFSLQGFTTAMYMLGGDHLANTSNFPGITVTNNSRLNMANLCTLSGFLSVDLNSEVTMNMCFITHSAAGICQANNQSRVSISACSIAWSPAAMGAGVVGFDAATGSWITVNSDFDINTPGWTTGIIARASSTATVDIMNAAITFTTVSPATYPFVTVQGFMNITNCSATLDNSGVAQNGGSGFITLSSNVWNIDNDNIIFLCQSGKMQIDDETINIGVGFNPPLLEADNGQCTINLAVVGGGPSTGARFTVAGGSVITGTPVAAANWGADNQAALVPTALGLILA